MFSYCFATVIITILITQMSVYATSSSWRRFFDVENLIVEPDYRAVNLKWNYYQEHGLRAFIVRFCEISAWNSKIRCRERHLPLSTVATGRRLNSGLENGVNLIDKIVRVNKGTYEASIYDLRMLTNYTFMVKADFDPSSATFAMSAHPAILYTKYANANNRPHVSYNDHDDSYGSIIVETKGFSARTNRCLANTSDVIVNTGPYFSGKISVEDANNNRCSVYGNRSSVQDIYTLTILHDVCGSKIINNSRIETMVMVHENKEILTHNSRRFLVVCNFVPETFTLKASVAMPTHLLKRKKSEDHHHHQQGKAGGKKEFPLKPISHSVSETDINERSNDIFVYENHKQHNVRDSRMLAHQEHRVSDTVKNNHQHYWSHFISTIMFVVSGFVFCVIALLWYVTSPRVNEKENQQLKYLSMTSTMISEKVTQGNGTALVSVNGSPVALVAIKPLGESFA